MKFARPLFIGLGIVAVILVVGIAAVFNSGVQTWAVRRALASRPDVKGTVESVSAGLHRVEMKNARLEKNGAVLTLPSAVVELPVLKAGLDQEIFITRLVAKG